MTLLSAYQLDTLSYGVKVHRMCISNEVNIKKLHTHIYIAGIQHSLCVLPPVFNTAYVFSRRYSTQLICSPAGIQHSLYVLPPVFNTAYMFSCRYSTQLIRSPAGIQHSIYVLPPVFNTAFMFSLA